MAKTFHGAALDLAAFTRTAGHLAAVEPLAAFPRLASAATGDASEALVDWSARGEQRAGPTGAKEPWLQVSVQTALSMRCERCLGVVVVPLAVDRCFRFLPDEESAAREDELGEVDVLVASDRFDLHSLIEDELILELPMAARHNVCLAAPPVAANQTPVEAKRQRNPFADLAALKRGVR